MFMILTANGKKRIPVIRKRMLLCIFACAWIFSSCLRPMVTITDVYYIHNDLDKPVSLIPSFSVAWDTCATGEFVRVWCSDERIAIPANKTIRLHPIDRDFDYPGAHRIEPGHILGSMTRLVCDNDTVVWESQYGHMFTSDEIYSIYNKNNWKTVSDKNRPNTYHSTFNIIQSAIEGREQP